jgi:DAPG hydrolase PhiG domain
VMNNRFVRRATLPARLPGGLATHCAEEYANLASLLPELHARFGPGAR